MLKRKKIVSKLLATTMVLTSFTVNASAAEVTSTTIGGNDRYETAIKISENGWSKSDRAILINGEKGLVDALTATPYAYSKNAPILITAAGKLSPATANRLKAMDVKNVDIVGGVNSVSNQVVNDLKAMGITVNRISGASRYDTSLAVAKELDKIQDVSEIAVVNGDKGIPDAVSVAAPAASKKMPILLAENSGLSSASKDFVNGESVSKSYVIGSNNSVSDTVMNTLPGTKTRLGGADRHDTNAAVIKEFYTAASWNNVYVAKSGFVKTNDEIVDALAAGVLAAKNGNPIVLVGNSINTSQQSLLASKKFSKMTQIGMGIPANSVNQIKATQADAESNATSVSVVDYKTIKIKGSNLNLIDKSKVSLSGNTVSSYTVNSDGTEATIVFNNAFSGTNSVKVTSNLGKIMELSFTYSSEVNSVQTTTSEISVGGIQYLKFTVNGSQTKSIDELKSLGWKIEFKANDKVFYDKTGLAIDNSMTSENGKLRTSSGEEGKKAFELGKIYSYEVTLTNGSKVLKSNKLFFEVVDKSNLYSEITSFKVQTGNLVKLDSTKLVVDETANLVDIKGKDTDGNVVDISNDTLKSDNFKVTSSNSSVISVNQTTKELKAQSTGSATITVSNGNVSKTINLTVSSEARKFNTLTFSPSTVYVGLDKEVTVVATAKDQYGDLIKGERIFKGSEKVLSDGKEIATIVLPVEKESQVTNEEGKLNVKVKADAVNSGSGSFTVKDTNKTYATLNVNTKKLEDNDVDRWKLEIDQVDSVSKDNQIDVYDVVGDKTVDLDLNRYNSNYFYDTVVSDIDTTATSIPENGYYVASSNEDVATVSQSGGKITVTAVKNTSNSESTSTSIKLYYKGSLKDTFNVVVKDSTPKITKISANSIGTLNYDKDKAPGEYDVINNLFNITNENSENVVEGLTISGKSGKVIYTPGEEEASGSFNIGATPLAKVKVETDFGATVSGGKVNIPNKKITKGHIIVKVYNGAADSGNPFETYTIEVNVEI
ncbi:cell wall-binding repeat-containing protein [Metaclostridioides mangenotii]|uniref:Cell wall-binding protein n=1 Tax=Metaclostridioides mangenotii TaxID=1540 RepID=A0ABS4EBG6_9FIRM|nr:cell wall-binding repeat-containing protein [Clostridioides mangenotii]MBP1855281.1 putative cell wall-binding protein [Clostridioides mangenotii]